MDVPFYAALRGREFSGVVEAAEDFVEHGMRLRLSPHPFLDFVSLPPEVRRGWRQGRVAQVLDHLTGEDGVVRPVGPLSEPADPTSTRAHMLAVAERLGRETAGTAGAEPPPVEWRSVAEQPRSPSRTSVVVAAAEPRRTIRAVDNLLRHADGHELEVVVVDRGAPPPVALGLHASFHRRPEVQLLRVPPSVSAAVATDLGLAGSTGQLVAVLEPHVQLRRHWLTELLRVMADPDVAGVQPLLLQPDDTIESAGLVVLSEDRGPVPLLAGHPKEDARRLRDERLVAISGSALVLRAEDVAAVGGLGSAAPGTDAALDLCARLLSRRPGGFRVAPTSLATALPRPDAETRSLPPYPPLPADPGIHRRIGFTTEWRDAEASGSSPELVVTGSVRDTADQLRWSLQLPSGPGRKGDAWGDTHFADALAEALRGLGQYVVTRRRGAHDAGPTHLDDVALALRGLHPIPPRPGQLNVLWVISHPDEVDPAELDGYDLVFAASTAWSAELSARAGRAVIPLLQATEFARPNASTSPGPRRPSVVFVGQSDARRDRPLVRKAVEAGVPLTVYGPGWDDLPEGVWRGEYVDNRHLPALYHEHGIVLADHWPDMARNGFVANRVFDALASGARVICDDVLGVHDVFDPREVAVARTPEEIRTIVAEWSRSAPQHLPRPALTFYDRAGTLLAEVSARVGQPSASRAER